MTTLNIKKLNASAADFNLELTKLLAWSESDDLQEHLLLIKANADVFAQIEQWLKQHHPYDVPEIIALDIAQGSLEYLQWIDQCLGVS